MDTGSVVTIGNDYAANCADNLLLLTVCIDLIGLYAMNLLIGSVMGKLLTKLGCLQSSQHSH